MNQSVHRFLIAMILALLIGGCATGGGSGGEQGESEENQAANANMQLGVQYLRRGELQKALSKLKKARAQAPDNANTQMMLGVVYSRLDKPALARDGFERAVELTPDNSQALNNYGKFLCQRGEFDRAGELFQRAADNPSYPRPAVPLTNAGSCQLRDGDRQAAEGFFQKALQKNRRQATALLELAEMRFEGENYMSARGYYQRYLDVRSQSPRSAWLGLRIEHALGNEDAVASLTQLLQGQFPDSDETSKLLKWERTDRL